MLSLPGYKGTVEIRAELELFASQLEDKLRHDYSSGVPEESVDVAITHLCDEVLKLIQINNKGQDVLEQSLEVGVYAMVVYHAIMRKYIQAGPVPSINGPTRPSSPSAKKRSGEWRLQMQKALSGERDAQTEDIRTSSEPADTDRDITDRAPSLDRTDLDGGGEGGA